MSPNETLQGCLRLIDVTEICINVRVREALERKRYTGEFGETSRESLCKKHESIEYQDRFDEGGKGEGR